MTAAAAGRACRTGLPREPVFPHPRCPTCGRFDGCTGEHEPYPECRLPLLGTSSAEVRRLLGWMAGAHEIRDPRFRRLSRTLVSRFERDHERYSEIFEPSFSFDHGAWQLCRFSYAFPGFRSETDSVQRTITDLSAPFGPRVAAHVHALARAFGDAAVEQPLWGVSYSHSGGWLVKLYLQFFDSRPEEALTLAARLLGRPDLPGLFSGRSLHLLGLDLADGGLVGAKLYFLLPEIECGRLAATVGPVSLVDNLASRGLRRLVDVLVIHRMARPDDPRLTRPTAIDFSLVDNDLHWYELRRCPTFLQHPDPGPLGDLESRFRLAVRRVSVPVEPASRENVYYVLTDTS